MYNWLFFKIYDYYIKRNNHDPLFNSVGLDMQIKITV